MKKLFGTDGIRGVAGQSPLDPATIHAVGLALAHHLGQRLSTRPHRPGHPRILRLDRRHPHRRPHRRRSHGRNRRRHHHARRRLPRPRPPLRGRHRHLRLAQSLAGQRHQALRPRRLQASRLHRTRHRSRNLPPPRVCQPTTELTDLRIAFLRPSTKPTAPNTSASCSPPSPASRSTAAASSSTAPTEPPAPSRHSSSPNSTPTAAANVILTHASPERPQHQRAMRRASPRGRRR